MPYKTRSAIGKIFLLCWLVTVIMVAQKESSCLSGIAHAQEEWRKEFEEVCSKTQDAMEFSPKELRGLIARCDALKPHIEKLDEPHRKVTLRRLQMCRDLYAYVLETKENQ